MNMRIQRHIKCRNINIDVIKALASFLVVTLHVCTQFIRLHPGQFKLDDVLYILAISAVPLFFMVNGYLLINKASLTYSYVAKKIVSILIIIFLWSASYSLIKLLLNQERINFFNTMILGITKTGGKFYNFWFLGTLSVLLFLSPIINYLMRKNEKIYFITVFLLFLTCILIKDYHEIKEPFRIWIFLFYYMIGGILGNERFKKIYDISPLFKYVFLLLLSILILSVTFYKTNFYNNFVWDNLNYSSIWVMLYSSATFYFLNSLNFKSNALTDIGNQSLGVYLVHWVLLPYLSVLHFTVNTHLAIATSLLVYSVSLTISLFLSKLPFFNKFVTF
ncbi:acyltransferase family protein [Erwinia sp. CPCC 100877]|nr:acyltransferase family protein [Erwinia sp. CPCC 100877]